MPGPPQLRCLRRLRRLVPVAIAVTSFVPPCVGTVAASPIDDQERRVQELTDELERLQEQSAMFAEQYNVALLEQRELTEDIKETQGRIARKEARVGELRDDLASVAVDAFVDAGSGGFGALLQSSDTYSETRQRQEYSRVALDVGSDTTDERDEAVADLEDERDELEDRRAEAEDLAEAAADARERAEASADEYAELRADAEVELGRLIQAEEERRAREAYERMLAEQARQQQLEAQQQAEQQARQQAAEQQAAQKQAAADEAAPTAPDEAPEPSEAVPEPGEPAPPPPQAPAPPAEAAPQQPAEQAAPREPTASPPPAEQVTTTTIEPSIPPVPTEAADDEPGSDPDIDSDDDDEPAGYAPAPPPPPPPPPPADEEPSGPTSLAQIAINAALSEVGTPWVFAMAEPGVGFDCSGLTSWAWAQAGVSMPHQSAQQYAILPHVPVSSAQPGDLLFFYSAISHVGIYLGDGQQVHSPNSTTTVKVAPVRWDHVVGAARPG